MPTQVSTPTHAPSHDTERESSGSGAQSGSPTTGGSRPAAPRVFRRLFTELTGENPPPPEEFVGKVFGVIADNLFTDIDGFIASLDPETQQPYIDAARQAKSHYDADLPHAGRIADDLNDLRSGGDVAYNTRDVMTRYAALTTFGKRWLRESPNADSVFYRTFREYIASDALTSHAVEIADLPWTDMTQRVTVARRRKQACETVLRLLRTGRLTATETTSRAETGATTRTEGDSDAASENTPAAGTEEAPMDPDIARAVSELRLEIEAVLPDVSADATVEERRSARASDQAIDRDTFNQLVAKIHGAEPRVREILYEDAALLNRLASAGQAGQGATLMRGLDPLDTLYRECRSAFGLPDATSTALAHQGNNAVDISQAKTRSFNLVRAYLLRRPASDEASRAYRNRVIEHTRLKTEILQRLSNDDEAAVYRMVVRGTDEPTMVDRIHAAVRSENGADAAAALLELSTTDPEALAALEEDLIFRNSIARLNDEVEVQGIPVRPYHLCLRLWGRPISSDVDPMQEAGSVQENPNPLDDRPLNVEERKRVVSEVLRPTAEALRDELTSWSYVSDSTITSQVTNFGRKAARPEYVTLFRRSGKTPGAWLREYYETRYGKNLRSHIREGCSSEARRIADRILNVTVDSAAIGTINGETTRAGDRPDIEGPRVAITLDQALRETVHTKTNRPLSELIHSDARTLKTELHEGLAWHGADLDDVQTIAYRVKNRVELCKGELMQLTGLPTIQWTELLSNAYAEIDGSLERQVKKVFSGSDERHALEALELDASSVSDRNRQAEARQQAANPEAAFEQNCEQLYSAPAASLFAKLTGLASVSMDDQFADAREALEQYATLGSQAPARPLIAPLAAPSGDAEERQGLRVSDTSDRNKSTPDGYYRVKYGITPAIQIDRIARVLARNPSRTPQRTAGDYARLLGLDPSVIDSAIEAPSEELEITDPLLVRPEFTVATATHYADEIWKLLHTNGRLHLIDAVLYGPFNDEEQRLIRVAFRRLSGGIDFHFYVQQAIALRDHVRGVYGSQGGLDQQNYQYSSTVGAEGTAAGSAALDGVSNYQRGSINVNADLSDMQTTATIGAAGELSQVDRLQAAVQNRDDDQVYRVVDELDDADCRRVMRDQALMHKMQDLLSGAGWDRVYRVLTGQGTLADRMVSRSEVGWIFDSTDEDEMREDIQRYIARLRRKHREAVRKRDRDARSMRDPRQSDAEVERLVRADCMTLAANADVRAIIEDELSGYDRSQMEGVIFNAGEEDMRAHLLRDGDWTDPEDEIIAGIRQMSHAQRVAMRDDPEAIRRLSDLCDTQEDFREAMNALMADHDSGTQPSATDHLSKLDEASRSHLDVAGDGSRDEAGIIENLSSLTEAEYRRLLADPQLRAQVLGALDDDPKERELALRMMAFRFEDAAADLGVDVAREGQQPGEGELSQADAEKLAYLKYNAVSRILAITEMGRSWDRMLRTAVEVYKLDFGGRPTTRDEGERGQALPGTEHLAAAEQDAPEPTTERGQAAATRRQRGIDVRQTVWIEVGGKVRSWARNELDSGDRTRQIGIVRDAVVGLRDPSHARIAENVGAWDDDDDIVETLENASDDVILREWSSVVQPGADGKKSMRAVYDEYAALRQQELERAASRLTPAQREQADRAVDAQESEASVTPVAADPAVSGRVRAAIEAEREPAPSEAPATQRTPPTPPAGSELSRKRFAFINYVAGLSQMFQGRLLQHAGGWFSGPDGPVTDADGRPLLTAARDNNEWHDWADKVRNRIPLLGADKIAPVLGISRGDPDYELIDNPNRTARTREARRLHQYLRSVGTNANDNGFAGDERERYSQALTGYRRDLAEQQTNEAGGHGMLTSEEESDNEELYGKEVDEARGAYIEAKAAIGKWAALIVGVLVTALVTVLTAGSGGPLAVSILLAGLAAGSGALAAEATREMVGGADNDFSKQGLQTVAQAAVTGMITAGATYYAQVVTRAASAGVANLQGQAAQVASALRTSTPSLFTRMGVEIGEEVLSENLQGFAEAGLAMLDPTHWLEGFDEGWVRAGGAAVDRISQIPQASLQATITVAALQAKTLIPGLRGNTNLLHHDVTHQVAADRIRTNFRAYFVGDVDDVVTEAVVSFAVEKAMAGHIDLDNLGPDMFEAILTEFKEKSSEMIVGYAHAAKLRRDVNNDLRENGDRLTAAERAHFLRLNQEQNEQRVLALGGDELGATSRITVEQYARARRQSALDRLDAWSDETGYAFNDDQREAWVQFVRDSRDNDEMMHRLAVDPLRIFGERGGQTEVDVDEERVAAATDGATAAAGAVASAAATSESLPTTVEEATSGQATETTTETPAPTADVSPDVGAVGADATTELTEEQRLDAAIDDVRQELGVLDAAESSVESSESEGDQATQDQVRGVRARLAGLLQSLGVLDSAKKLHGLAVRLGRRLRNRLYVFVHSLRSRRQSGPEGPYTELHNHFLGVAGNDVFAARAARAQGADAAVEGTGIDDSELIGGIEILRFVASQQIDQKLAHTRDESGAIADRGGAGDAIDFARQEYPQILAELQRIRESGGDVDPMAIEALSARVQLALQYMLAASTQTDFNSAYEVRDEVLKRYFGELKAGGTDVTDHGQIESEAFGGDPMVARYADYAKEAIRRLIEDDIEYSEQSNSMNKLAKRFPPDVMAQVLDEVLAERLPAKRAQIEEDVRSGRITPEEGQRLQQRLGLVLTQLALIPTLHFTDQADSRSELDGQRGFNAALDQLFGILERHDVVGMDIAGQELFRFGEKLGAKRFKVLVLRLAAFSAKQVEAGKPPIVFRPHVGEGALQVDDGAAYGDTDARRRQGERRGGEQGPMGDRTAEELEHYDIARHNLSTLLEVLADPEIQAAVAASGLKIRFGHVTHATPAQARRMAELGIHAEINLTSNLMTESLDQTRLGEGGERSGEPRFDDHSLLTMIYFQVSTMLSTDAQAVMSTSMKQEYARAREIIDGFLRGRTKLRLDRSAAIDPATGEPRGTKVVIGAGTETETEVYELGVGDLTGEELERFLGGYAKLHSDARAYGDRARDEAELARERRDDATGSDTDPDGGTPPRSPIGPVDSDDDAKLRAVHDNIAEHYADDLEGRDTRLVAPPEGAPVLTTGSSDALIGLPTDVVGSDVGFDEALASMQEGGIPRYGALTVEERRHEESFIAEIEADMEGAVDQMFAMSDEGDGKFIFEVDAAKRIYSAYGSAKKAKDATAEQVDVRLTANHALHPAAVMLTRLAFIKRLDELAALEDGHPLKKVFVTSGGCAAGKGSLTGLVEEKTGEFSFGATWDAAGEGDAQENGWILAAARARGLEVTFGFVDNDPITQYQSVVDRAQVQGRIVDPVTFMRSYISGLREFKAFMDSPEYQQAAADGSASAFAMFTGQFNKGSLEDKSQSEYPDARMLGDDGVITDSEQLPEPADESEVLQAALAIFDEWRKAREEAGDDVDSYFIGAILNALKFGRPSDPLVDVQRTQMGTMPSFVDADKVAALFEGKEPGSLDDIETRDWYHAKLAEVDQLIDRSLPVKEQALMAHAMRNEVKMAARMLMADQAKAASLPPPRSLNDVVARLRAKGLQGDALWQAMVGSAQRSNAEVDADIERRRREQSGD